VRNVLVIEWPVIPAEEQETAAEPIGRDLMELASQHKKIVISLSGVFFLSTVFIGKFVLFNKKMKVNGNELCFCSIKASVLEVFRITRLDKVFKIVADEEKAISELNKE